MHLRRWLTLTLWTPGFIACLPVEGGMDDAGAGGSPAAGGSLAIGGNAAGGAQVSVGGASAGGSLASGGAGPFSGGADHAGGASGGGLAAGGTPATGGGQTSGGADAAGGSTGGGPSTPVKSAGCGKAGPQTGSSGQPLKADGHDYYVKLPSGYDPATPYKVIIVFPPTGNAITWSEQNAGYEQAAPDAVRVYTHMANESSGWQPNETGFFQALYDSITSNFCVDEAHIFAAGESSGGEFAAFLGCEYGDLLRGVAPGAPKTTSWQISLSAHDGCKGHPAAVVIWSPKDNVLTSPAGPQFRDFYHDMNTCGDTTVPVEGYTDAKSNCEMYEGCMAGSDVYFCQHQDPTYSSTYHGWAAFAGKMTWKAFSEY